MNKLSAALTQLPTWVKSEVVAWRRQLHQYPELSFEEHRTAQFIRETLASFNGFEISSPTATSVVAKLKGAHPGRKIAFRADIDALPIKEETELPYASQHEGVMHACGHDGHTAILLAAAKALSESKHLLHGEIVFIFQHAEELPPGGAEQLVAANVLDGVELIIGLHLASQLPVGKIGIVYGEMAASPDNFTITVHGAGGHAGFPHTAIDPITTGAQIVTGLQHIVSRMTNPLEKLVVSITQFTAGASHNVIPDKATIKGTVRSFSSAVREQAPKQIQALIDGIASAHGAKAELHYVYGYHPVVNDDQVTALVESTAGELLGEEAIQHSPPGMSGEDFSAYQQIVPGAFFNVGAGNLQSGIHYPHHHSKFNIDEQALEIGTLLFIELGRKLLHKQEH
ncbi:N-acyl-L-amino acid amidohydrolase [Paenibacillus montaniterrae]|uniref:N-acyl-L-amino acid amidohydrolase n=1 Tax=Paenibacillus montaniterrae TaxID=429341 RepID=A0A919YMG0_9BACL|nr:amidohydrolase [Paenibacillus montaniterrae]GIP14806.1 N-acyl-L-amino acid amidohydrolase [Paenibacillus montaniterrae]